MHSQTQKIAPKGRVGAETCREFAIALRLLTCLSSAQGKETELLRPVGELSLTYLPPRVLTCLPFVQIEKADLLRPVGEKLFLTYLPSTLAHLSSLCAD